jgi:2-amino-4-hydroxy-6-hydroxymethyldihydropteridine diphosphokinase
MSKSSKIYLILGSNLGNRVENMRRAQTLIAEHIGKIKQVSRLYESQPWGKSSVATQLDYLNQAIEVSTLLTPQNVLIQILNIEKTMGRVRTEKNAPRLMDIDIALWGDEIIKMPDLIIPHPRLHERNFVLIPLMEIAGEDIHPELQLPIEEIYFSCTDPLEVSIFED